MDEVSKELLIWLVGKFEISQRRMGASSHGVPA